MLLQDIIQNIESRSLTNREIEAILGDPEVRVVDYSVFDDVDDLSDIFTSGVEALIILLRTRESGIGHWVTLINSDTRLEYFGSYGLTLRDSLQIAVADSDSLLRLIDQKIMIGWTYSENHVQLQKIGPAVNTCGMHAVVRASFRHLNNPEYVKMIKAWCKTHKFNPDEAVVSLMVIDLLRTTRSRGRGSEGGAPPSFRIV